MEVVVGVHPDRGELYLVVRKEFPVGQAAGVLDPRRRRGPPGRRKDRADRNEHENSNYEPQHSGWLSVVRQSSSIPRSGPGIQPGGWGESRGAGPEARG